MSNEAKEYIKSKHNGEIPYNYGANECAKLMQSYADQEVKKALEGKGKEIIDFREQFVKLLKFAEANYNGTTIYGYKGEIADKFIAANKNKF